MKGHLVIAREPVQRWATHVEGACGFDVENPVPVSMGLIAPDLGRTDMPEMNSLRDCNKCFRILEAEAKDNKQRLWVYGIASGQALMNEEELS